MLIGRLFVEEYRDGDSPCAIRLEIYQPRIAILVRNKKIADTVTKKLRRLARAEFDIKMLFQILTMIFESSDHKTSAL